MFYSCLSNHVSFSFIFLFSLSFIIYFNICIGKSFIEKEQKLLLNDGKLQVRGKMLNKEVDIMCNKEKRRDGLSKGIVPSLYD